MKVILPIVIGLFSFGAASAKQDPYKDREVSYPSSLKTLNVSSSSKISYSDAMNRFHAPTGYAISSIKYARNGYLYVVMIRMVKVGG